MSIISIDSGKGVVLTEFDEDGRASRRKLLKSNKGIFGNRINILFELTKLLKNNKYRLIYIRHFLSDPIFILFLCYIKIFKNKIIRLIEVPTYPYDGISEFNTTHKAKLMLSVDKITRHLLMLFIDRVISIGYHEKIFGIESISIANGINIESYKLANPIEFDNKIRIIGVGYLKNYHGYDRLIKTIETTNANQKAIDIEFHIVSPETPELIKLKTLVSTAGLESNFLYHGYMDGAELDALFDYCHIAIASLAWHRVGVHRHSNLKTKEYMARGIPFVYSGEDEQLPNNYEYTYRLPPNESEIELSLLLKFFEDMKRYQFRSPDMRNYAHKYMNWSTCMIPVISYIRSKKYEKVNE